MPYLLTLIYIVLAYLSPADLFPGLAPYRIQLWVSGLGLVSCLPRIPIDRVRIFVPQTFLLIGLMGMTSFSRLINKWYGGAFTAWYEFGITAVVYFLILITAQSLPRVRRLAYVVVFVTLFLIA